MGHDNIPEMFPRAMRENLEKRFAGSNALALGTKALLSGALCTEPGHIEWDCAGDCREPQVLFEAEVAEDMLSAIKREAKARRAARDMVRELGKLGIIKDVDECIVRSKPHPVGIKVSIFVRCRKCDRCRENRRRRWSARAISEWEASERTWFGTLTLSPAAHDHFKLQAQRDCGVRATDFDAFSPDEQFLARHRAIGAEITRWLKRVRKNSGAKVRFLLVAEQHKSGLPHYHAMIHEGEGPKVEYRVLRDAWRVGFSQFKLVSDQRAASYVCKYLSKSALARVRASSRYGNNVPEAVAPLGAKLRTSKLSPPPNQSHGRDGRPIGGLARNLV
jgi:hypothetical protein